MTKIEKLIKKLSAITEAQQEQALLGMIQKDERWIVDLNRVQLLEGRDSNNKMLKRYRSKSYARYKRTLNPLGVTDLRLTGKFHKGFVLKAESFPLTITSTDSKRAELVKKYGNSIFGLTNEGKGLLVIRLKSKARAFYRKLIRL